MNETQAIDRLFLELAQFTTAKIPATHRVVNPVVADHWVKGQYPSAPGDYLVFGEDCDTGEDRIAMLTFTGTVWQDWRGFQHVIKVRHYVKINTAIKDQ